MIQGIVWCISCYFVAIASNKVRTEENSNFHWFSCYWCSRILENCEKLIGHSSNIKISRVSRFLLFGWNFFSPSVYPLCYCWCCEWVSFYVACASVQLRLRKECAVSFVGLACWTFCFYMLVCTQANVCISIWSNIIDSSFPWMLFLFAPWNISNIASVFHPCKFLFIRLRRIAPFRYTFGFCLIPILHLYFHLDLHLLFPFGSQWNI